jgi:hypothetical protein
VQGHNCRGVVTLRGELPLAGTDVGNDALGNWYQSLCHQQTWTRRGTFEGEAWTPTRAAQTAAHAKLPAPIPPGGLPRLILGHASAREGGLRAVNLASWGLMGRSDNCTICILKATKPLLEWSKTGSLPALRCHGDGQCRARRIARPERLNVRRSRQTKGPAGGSRRQE